MTRIDDDARKALLTLGLAIGGYALAVCLPVSLPIVAVCAGLLIGDVGARSGMSADTRTSVAAYQNLIGDILNAVLCPVVGVVIVATVCMPSYVTAGLAAIVLGAITLRQTVRDNDGDVIRMIARRGTCRALNLSLPAHESP